MTGCSEEATRRPADVAIVGSGPVGMKLALDLGDAGLDVLLIESGHDADDAAAQALGDAKIVSGTHAAMHLATRRGIGGTSRLWGGRAVAFDDLDFSATGDGLRAAWPIGPEDVRPWYPTACEFLDCGPPVFDSIWEGRPASAGGLRLTALERWCAQPDMRRAHGERLASHPKVRLALNATALRVVTDTAGQQVVGLEIARAGTRLVVKARAYVVAAGGVETARLLLASRAETPMLFGGPQGALGRFYMGHVFGSISDIQFLDPAADQQFDFHKDLSGRYVRRRLTLDAETQARLGLLNLSAWPELPELHAAEHRSAILSLAYLALAAPVLGPRLMAPAIRRRKLGPGPVRIAAHLGNLITGAPAAALFAARFLRARYADKVRLPGFFIRNSAHRYPLHYHAEQAPRAESCVTLLNEQDALGMPRARVDLRFGEADARSVVASHDALSSRLEAAGIACLEHRFAPDAREQAVLQQASDGFHQVGTARMAAEPGAGVVDRDARVHGLSNLFLAGSAIFASSGQANPTLLAVALAARLAAHLRQEVGALPD